MSDKLYNLLPALYRLRDVDRGETLRALLGVIESELDNVQGDIARLYDNWFIETCDEWVVPYISDLLGVRGLLSIQSGGFSQRGLVANTLDYRRRKGTAAMLERLAHDLTGWDAKAVEFFQLLDTTQFMNHVRPENIGTISLRDTNALELLNGPFDRAAHTAEVRHIDNARGRYNIPNIGLFLWRLSSYNVVRSTARSVADPTDGRYQFNPLGLDALLFNLPQTKQPGALTTAEVNVPEPLRRRALFDELEARRKAMVDGVTPRPTFFGVNPVLEVWTQAKPGDPFNSLLPEELVICNLEDWRRPTADTIRRKDGTSFTIAVAVDPALGRLSFPNGVTPNKVEVSYGYGFPGDLGGGPYSRRSTLQAARTRPVTWQMGVVQNATGAQTNVVATLAEAINAWNSQPAGTAGLVAVMDSGSYREDLTGPNAIHIPAGSQLILVAGDWHDEPVPDQPNETQRVVGHVTPEEVRPHLRGNIEVQGTAGAGAPNPGEFVLNGLLIEGTLTVLPGNLGTLRVQDSTLVPQSGGLVVNAGAQSQEKNDALAIIFERTISGPLNLANTVRALDLTDSIVDGHGGSAIAASASRAAIESATIFGPSAFSQLEASNTIFTGAVTVTRRQLGCVRFSYLPINSLAPRRYRCQPNDPATAGRIVPQFTSTEYGAPAYGQLAFSSPAEISTGAEDEGEQGAFHFMQQVQRVRNLQASLDEYLRFGLEAGILFVT